MSFFFENVGLFFIVWLLLVDVVLYVSGSVVSIIVSGVFVKKKCGRKVKNVKGGVGDELKE